VHVDWLRERGWGKAQIFLPHDGATHDRVYDVSFESAFRAAGFNVEVIPNQGRGAARARIEALRRLFPSLWFNADTTEAGRDALGWYHERRSEDVRDVGLGPEHDWASHSADAAGLMAVAYETPAGRPKAIRYPQLGIV
jgi:phage terminase large subunit